MALVGFQVALVPHDDQRYPFCTLSNKLDFCAGEVKVLDWNACQVIKDFVP